MDVRDFVKGLVTAGEKQVAIAKKAGVSQGTIYKLLYTETKPTMDIIMKIAKGYSKQYTDFVVAEDSPAYSASIQLTDSEQRLLTAFRSLDQRRKERFLETIEDIAAALKG